MRSPAQYTRSPQRELAAVHAHCDGRAVRR